MDRLAAQAEFDKPLVIESTAKDIQSASVQSDDDPQLPCGKLSFAVPCQLSSISVTCRAGHVCAVANHQKGGLSSEF